MTLKEIQKQIDEARAAPINEDGTSEYFNLLPRVYYSELPAKLKAEADKITIDDAKRFLLELYPVGALDRFLDDPIELNLKICKALRAAKYLVESTKTTSSGAAGSVSLIGADFAAAWEDVAGIATPVYISPNFNTIRQGAVTNAMTKLRAVEGKNTDVDPRTNEAKIYSKSNSRLTVMLPRFNEIGSPKTSTWQLLNMLVSKFTETGAKSYEVNITLDEYMEMRDLRDRKEARAQVDKDLEILRVLSFTYKDTKGAGAEEGYYKTNMAAGVGRSRSGVITLKFTSDFYNLLMGYNVMPFPNLAYKLNSKRNPNSYYFLTKIAEHKNMNISKQNEDIISVAALLKTVYPMIPSYKEVMETDRHLDKRIIAPFERDMDALKDALTWEYCHSKGEPLTAEEINNFNYQIFKDCLIKVTWVDYPDQSARRQQIAEAREKKKKTTRKGG